MRGPLRAPRLGRVRGVSRGSRFSEVAGDRTEVAGGSSEVAGGSAEVAGGSSEVAGGSSEVAGGSSEVAGGCPCGDWDAAEVHSRGG